jgi:hypothetical protein
MQQGILDIMARAPRCSDKSSARYALAGRIMFLLKNDLVKLLVTLTGIC